MNTKVFNTFKTLNYFQLPGKNSIEPLNDLTAAATSILAFAILESHLQITTYQKWINSIGTFETYTRNNTILTQEILFK